VRTLFALALAAVPAAAQPGLKTISSYGTTVSGTGAASYGAAPAALYIDAGRPVAAFGVVKARGQPDAYSYFIVFKTDPAAKTATFRSGGEQSGTDAKVTGAVHVGGAERWTYKFEFAMDETTGKVTKEVLTAGGKEYKLAEARVFLVDLTAEKPTVKAVKTTPPKPVPALAKDLGWIEDVAKAAAQLRADSPEVKAFLGPAPKE
jgi:hypothetical protein